MTNPIFIITAYIVVGILTSKWAFKEVKKSALSEEDEFAVFLFVLFLWPISWLFIGISFLFNWVRK